MGTNARSGFATLTLIVVLAGAGLAGALTLQSWRLSAAQEALGAERVGKALALARIEALSAEKRAAEAALADRDAAHEAIRRFGVQTARKLTEVGQNDAQAADWLDRTVPAGIKRLLADRRSRGQPGAAPTDDTAATVPAPGRGSGDAPRPDPAAAGVR